MTEDIDKPEVSEAPDELLDGKGQTNIIPILGSVKPGEQNKDNPGKHQARLTDKQMNFCREVVKGNSLAQAYRNSYSAEDMSDGAVWTESSRLASRPHVSLCLERLRQDLDRSARHTGQGLRDHIIRGLYDLTEKADTDASRLRAFELLGKTELVSLFVERTSDVTEDMSPEQVQEALETKLKQAFGE